MKQRCAVYVRKSTEEGLDQDFNSLDNQREACLHFIASQRESGWVALPDRYEDGGFSGGNLDRPGLKRLLEEIEAGRVDVVVVHRLDRLSRSLRDFTRLMETFEARGVTFTSVTQQFNTGTSMGRLTLNILLSFAQFEREITVDRIREKVAAEKRRGKFCGGKPPLGYDIDPRARKLLVNSQEAQVVRAMFAAYTRLGSCLEVAKELNQKGWRTKSWVTKKGNVITGKPWDRSLVHAVLKNPLYAGWVVHQGQRFAGEHEALVSPQQWEATQKQLSEGQNRRRTRSQHPPSLLQGLVFCQHCQAAMTPTWSRKRGKEYRYYLCTQANRSGYATCPVRLVAAGILEEAVQSALCQQPHWPQTLALFGLEQNASPQSWQSLEVARRRQVLGHLVRRVWVGPEGLKIEFFAGPEA